MSTRMKLTVFVAAVACAMSLVSTMAYGQTVANGPYYATPSWDQKFPCDTSSNCPRFVVLSNWNNEAVLDRETGVVWERQPGLFPFEQSQSWSNSSFNCVQKGTGGRKGWRLATVQDLQSLSPLPAGHPFIGDFSRLYWSATPLPGAPQYAFAIGVLSSFGALSITESHYFWCVRSPSGPAN
jgi:hypothetical protein